MSEYWKSTPKYWCKHCSTYVKDTPFERKQHENTGKHQGNLKRFLRGIQNDHEREERDKSKVRAEVERLNRVVGSPSTLTSSKGSASSANPTFTKAKSGVITAEDQKRQWAQLAEMGIEVPGSAQKELAVAGDWKVVAKDFTYDNNTKDALSVGVRKRKTEDAEDEEEAESHVVQKGWGSRTKRYPNAEKSGDIDDLLNGPPLKKEKVSNKDVKVDIEHDDKTNLSSHAQSEVKSEPLEGTHTSGSGLNTNIEVQQPAPQLEPKQELKDNDSSLPAATHPVDDTPIFKKRRGKPKNNLNESSGAT